MRIGDVILKEETIDLMCTNQLADEQLKNYWFSTYLSYYKRNFNGGSAIANGKHILEEEGIVVNVSEYTTRLLEKCKWEAHKKYSLIINLQK